MTEQLAIALEAVQRYTEMHPRPTHVTQLQAAKGRIFTAYSVILCRPEDLDRVEAEYISRLDPPQNKTQRALRPSR